MTKLAKLIGKMEGFGRKGATPTIKHNPGDLRHSPHSSHAGEGPNDIGKIDTDAHGWMDLERQLVIFEQEGLTLEGAIYAWTGTSVLRNGTLIIADGNNPKAYLAYICEHMGMPADTPLTDALKVMA